ncbi:abortive infection family protein, partial [Sphingobium sp.]|uniref:abortive infection family protein n=2 Tax=Sphingobium TaxID=165695 RepID=UPI003BB55A80
VYFKIVGKFEGEEHVVDSTGIEAFEANETLQELVAAIRRDLDAGRPNAGLDRLHTYCMKRFASLVVKHGGEPCGENDALHARVGKYAKALKASRNLTEMSDRIIKSSISTFESMNEIRNNKSFAHDNESLVSMDEAKFIYDSVTALLRFIKTMDAQKFED